jgi:hypothetical protein
MGSVVLGVNVLWFGLAFRMFGLRARRAVRLLVPPETEGEIARGR